MSILFAIISYLFVWYDNFAWQKFTYSESRKTLRFHHGTLSGVCIGRRSVHGNLKRHERHAI